MPKHSSKKSTHQKAPPKQPLYRSRPPRHSHYTPVYIPKEPTHKSRVINLDDERPSSPLAPDQYPRRSSFRYNDNSTEVLISDFRFIPDFIEVSMDSIVKWRIDRNETIHRSGIYGSETRSFVISVQHGNEHYESELLTKDQTFSYRFERAGTYHIKCANYQQIQGVVQVCGRKDSNSCSGLSSIAVEQVGSLSSCNEEDLKGQTATAVAVEKKPLEVKESPLFLLKDFGNEGIQELILELSLQSNSSKEGVSSKDGKGIDSNSEELDQTTIRYSMVKDQLLRKTEVNIFDELVSREFNGLKLKPRENGCCEMAQKNIKTSIEIEEEALLVTASSRIEEKNSEHSGEREEQHNFEQTGGHLPVLYSRKNPKDEEQKFDQAMTHSQECSEEEEEYVDNGKKFLEFIKDGVKNTKEKYRNRSRRGHKNRRKSSYKGPDEEEMEKIEALKAFLTNRFEFAEEFDM